MTAIRSISGPESLFDQADLMARQMNISFSVFVDQAIRNQIETLENNQGWPILEIEKEESIIEVKPVTDHIPKHPAAELEYQKFISPSSKDVIEKPKRCYQCSKFSFRDDGFLECIICKRRLNPDGSSIQLEKEITT